MANSLSALELNFLIDSVMYVSIINTQNSRSLAKRLQGLSGKISSGLRPTHRALLASKSIFQTLIFRKIRFRLNVFVAVNDKIALLPIKEHTVSPLETLLHSGQYYLIAACANTDKLYFFRIDLMTDITHMSDGTARSQDKFDSLKAFQRDRFTQVVDTFSNSLQIVPHSDTGKAVEVMVYASNEAMPL